MTIGRDESKREFSWTAPVALGGPSAAQENSVLIIDVTDVMALLGVTDVVALETYCSLLTAYFFVLASSREAGSWLYQPSMTLAALTAFFS